MSALHEEQQPNTHQRRALELLSAASLRVLLGVEGLEPCSFRNTSAIFTRRPLSFPGILVYSRIGGWGDVAPTLWGLGLVAEVTVVSLDDISPSPTFGGPSTWVDPTRWNTAALACAHLLRGV